MYLKNIMEVLSWVKINLYKIYKPDLMQRYARDVGCCDLDLYKHFCSSYKQEIESSRKFYIKKIKLLIETEQLISEIKDHLKDINKN